MEKQYFKYGEREYSTDDLLRLHAQLENSFYNFAKEQGKYDQEALKSLRLAVTSRINAIKNNQAFDGDGVLEGDNPDNITIRRRALLKKNRYIDQDNTEWARYYVNKLIEKMNPYTKEEVKPVTYNDSKHSFGSYLTGNGVDANSIFSQLDLQDPNDLTKARGNAERRAELRKLLEAYRNYLQAQGINFGADDNSFNDDYLKSLNDALANFDNLSDYELGVILRKLGAGDAFTTAFTSGEFSLKQETPEEAAARKKKEEEEKKKKEEKLKQERYREALDHFKSNQSQELRLGRKSGYQSILDGDKQKYSDFDAYYSDIADNEFQSKYGNTDLRSKPGTTAPEIAKKWQDQFYNLTNTALNDWDSVDPQLASATMEAVYENSPEQFVLLEGGLTYIPNTINNEGYALTYNPTTHTLYRSSIHNLALYNKTNERIMLDYQNVINNYIKEKHNVDYSDPNTGYVFAKGGILTPIHLYGGGITLDANKFGEFYKDRANENGVSEKTLRARDRYLNDDNKSTLNPNAGLDEHDIVRLATMGANLASMFFDPVTGTAVGVGTTATDFVNDMFDDSVTTGEALKGLGYGLAFDALGVIPVVGDALGTGNKILRTAVKLAPVALSALGAYQGVKNFDNMQNAWKKITKSGEDAKMTVEDWKNIALSILLLTGGVRAGRNYARQKKAVRESVDPNKAVVNVIDDQGNKQLLIVGGETLNKIKEIQKNGGDPKEVKKVLSELEEYKDKFSDTGKWEIETSSKWYNGWRKPWGKNEITGNTEWRNPRGDGRASIQEYVDYDKVRAYYGKNTKIGGKWSEDIFDKVNQRKPQTDASNAKTSAEIDEMIEAEIKNANLEGLAKLIPDAVNERKTILSDLDSKIQEVLGRTNIADGLPKKADLVKLQKLLQGKMTNLPSKSDMKKSIKSAENAQLKKLELNDSKNTITSNRDKAISDLKAQQHKLKSEQKNIKNKINNLKLKSSNLTKGLKGYLTRLNNLLNNLDTQIYTKKDLKQEINNINNTYDAKLTSIDNAQTQLDVAILKGNSMKALLKQYNKRNNKLQEVNKNLGKYKKATKAKRELKNLNNQKSSLDPTTNHTMPYLLLLNALNNMPTNIGGRNITWDMNDILSKYNINPTEVFKRGGSIEQFKNGGFKHYKNGDIVDTIHCAAFSNGNLREDDYLVSGDAWDLNHVDQVYSGYNTNVRPREWNLKDVEEYNANAADNFYKNFDSKTLDKNKKYVVNMYYKGSPSLKEAYENGRDDIAGTHTGYVTWNPKLNRWDLTHNIHKKIHVDPFVLTQGSGRQYGITAIYEPRKDTIWNRIKGFFGFKEGGVIDNQQEEPIDREQLIKYLNYAKR